MKPELLTYLSNAISFIRKIFGKEYAKQRMIDQKLEDEIISKESDSFKRAISTDVYLTRSKHDYKFCLRKNQYEAVSLFQQKHELTRAEISMALRTRLIKFPEGKKRMIKKAGRPPLHTLVFGILVLAAATAWFFFSINFKLLTPLDTVSQGLGNFSAGIVYLAMTLHTILYVSLYYMDASSIRARFKELKLIK